MDQNPAGAPNEPVISQPVGQPISQPAGQPTGQPMGQPVGQPMVEVVKPLKKSKAPIIITIIVLLLLAIGGAVAALVILKPFAAHEAVPAAISKLFSTGVPQNVKLAGAITVYDNNEDAMVPSVQIDFSSNMNTKTDENIATVAVNATLLENQNLAFNLDEIHTASGNLYLKLDGITNLEGLPIALDALNDQWVQIPDDDLGDMAEMMSESALSSCIASITGNPSEYGSSLKELYEASPFIEYSTENITIDKKKNPIYRLYFDSEKLTTFVNSVSNSTLASKLSDCFGNITTDDTALENDLIEVASNTPTIYVEIDDQDNFTRLYMAGADENGLGGATLDISFEYPTSAVAIQEPSDFITFDEFIGQLFLDFYSTDTIDDAEILTF